MIASTNQIVEVLPRFKGNWHYSHTFEWANMVAMETFLNMPRGLLMFFFTNSLSFGSLGIGDVGERTIAFLLPEMT